MLVYPKTYASQLPHPKVPPAGVITTGAASKTSLYHHAIFYAIISVNLVYKKNLYDRDCN
jgi:hypothetical protein